MATQTSLTNFDAFLKATFPPQQIKLLAASLQRPLLNWLPKSEEFGGASITVPVLWGNPAGRSADFSTALTNANTTQKSKFVITDTKKDYNVVQIESEVIMRSNRGDWSYAEAKALEIKQKLDELNKSLSISCFRSGSGSIGVVDSVDGTGQIITLTNKSDVHYFSVGMNVNFNNTDDATSLYTTDGSTVANPTVTKVDSSAGTITVDEDTEYSVTPGGGTDVGAGAYIFAEGDADAKLTGLEAWVPLTAPGASAFFGVDRTENITALSGHRVDNANGNLLDNGLELHTLIGEFGGKPDVWVMHPRAGIELAKDVGVKVERMDGKRAKVGFNGFTLVGHMADDIDVMFDYSCPRGRAYMLQRDTWKVYHVGGLPHIVQDDGLMVTRSNTFDGVECRGRYYAEVACSAPGHNGVMSVATD